MPTYVSDGGVFHASKEKVGLINRSEKSIEIESTSSDGKKFKQTIAPGEPYTYDGPCRAALYELWEADKTGAATTFGISFKRSPEFLQMLRDLNFKSAEEYLTWVGYDEVQAKKDFEMKSAKIAKHEIPTRVAELKRLGGGSDHATGKKIIYGGFGEPSV
tara:strand:- start:1696 stop:2175 length:480 start_codon:yes stop_codon:yes gene_type:complete